MRIQRLTRPFRQLRGKLTLSYTLTSVVAFLLVELIFIAIVFWVINVNVSNIIVNNLQQEASQAAPYFVHGSPDREALTSWLDIITTSVSKQGPFNTSPTFLTVVDTQGQTIASTGTHPTPVNMPIQTQLSPQNRTNFYTVLHHGKGTISTVAQEADGTLVAITPIVGVAGNMQGALVMKIVRPDIFQLVVGVLRFIVATVIIVTTLAALAGMVFGYLTARGLTHRLKGLSAAADKWGHGDFSALTHDTSQDELGQVSRQLNRMAEQLQNLLSARQKLATLEERNRLARDLHDSVKQQIFAVGMQLGATKILLKRDIAAAEVRLDETEQLVHQAQQELTSLIRELRPVALEGKGLVTALRELATQWTQQTDIVANLRVEGTQTTLPLTLEEALFRVAQEALANVARHSKATLVQMLMTTTDDTVILSVVDNGQGFDTTRQEHLGVGLLSMQERMKALGGDVQLESAPGKGTCIVARCKRLGARSADVTTTAAHGDEDHAIEHIQQGR